MNTHQALEYLEIAALKVLVETINEPGWCIGLDLIAKGMGTDRICASFILKRIRDKGLATYERGLFSEYGDVAGSGYTYTDKGIKHLQDQKGVYLMSYGQLLLDQKEPLESHEIHHLQEWLRVMNDDCETFGETPEDTARINAIKAKISEAEAQ